MNKIEEEAKRSLEYLVEHCVKTDLAYTDKCENNILKALESVNEQAVDVEEIAKALNNAAQKMPYDIRNHTPMVFYKTLADHLNAQGYLRTKRVEPIEGASSQVNYLISKVKGNAKYLVNQDGFAINYQRMMNDELDKLQNLLNQALCKDHIETQGGYDG